MPPKRDPLSNRDLKESLITFRVDESFAARINAKCGELDVRRSEMMIDALRWYFAMTDASPGIAFITGESIAKLGAKVGKIVVLLDQD